jgi:hypothetical protein
MSAIGKWPQAADFSVSQRQALIFNAEVLSCSLGREIGNPTVHKEGCSPDPSDFGPGAGRADQATMASFVDDVADLPAVVA